PRASPSRKMTRWGSKRRGTATSATRARSSGARVSKTGTLDSKETASAPDPTRDQYHSSGSQIAAGGGSPSRERKGTEPFLSRSGGVERSLAPPAAAHARSRDSQRGQAGEWDEHGGGHQRDAGRDLEHPPRVVEGVARRPAGPAVVHRLAVAVD